MNLLSYCRPLGSHTPLTLGRIVATPAARQLMAEQEVDPRLLLLRHRRGDWGEICPEDQAANAEALEHGLRVMSVYPLSQGRVWIITEADRSVTTILTPEDY